MKILDTLRAWAEKKEGGRRAELSAALSEAPHHARFAVVAGDRVELRDPTGSVTASMRAGRTLSSLEGQDGRLLVTFAPSAKVSGKDIATLAIDGAIFDGVSARPIGSSAIAAPALNLEDRLSRVIFAAVPPNASGGDTIALLPAGAVNDRAISRHLADDDVARIRRRSPLAYRSAPDGTGELCDAAQRVVARAIYPDAAPISRPRSHPQSIDFVDNDLPASWVFAILLACRHWVG